VVGATAALAFAALAVLQVRVDIWWGGVAASGIVLGLVAMVTASVVREIAAKTRARGSKPLFVVPALDSQRDLGWLLDALFEDQGVPVVVARVDSAHILPYDGHPDAQATKAMAVQVERALGFHGEETR